MPDRFESHETETGRGFAVAYPYLNRRERTVAEVRARLERAEVREEEIDVVISELLEFGYLDDARYARVFTQDKRTLAAWGNERIARGLRERGVDRELIEGALAEGTGGDGTDGGVQLRGGNAAHSGGGDPHSSADDMHLGHGGAPYGDGGVEPDSEFGRAVALLGSRFPTGPADRRDHERAFGVLARKGYESETAADAVREWARRRAR